MGIMDMLLDKKPKRYRYPIRTIQLTEVANIQPPLDMSSWNSQVYTNFHLIKFKLFPEKAEANIQSSKWSIKEIFYWKGKVTL